jgi:hypothetical protein
MRLARRAASLLLASALAAACSNSAGRQPPPPPPCEQECKDKVVLRAVRESIKLVFNLTLQGKAVGHHDETVPCPKGGRARVVGDATANAQQGATVVHLTYVLDKCGYEVKTDKPEETYALTASGSIQEDETIAVQPSSTTALVIKSDALDLAGTVYDPPIDYKDGACKVDVTQAGNHLSGATCKTNPIGLDL